MALAFLVGVATVPLLGGRLSRLEQLRLRSWPLLVGAFALQTLPISVWPTMPRSAAVALHLVSYALIAWFLALNRGIAGLWIVALGSLCNLVAIVANRGVMPAQAGALRTAGKHVDPTAFANSAPLANPRLWWLGDVFAVPRQVPLANVFSVGDVLIVVGAIVVMHQACGSRLLRRAGAADAAAPSAPRNDVRAA